VLYSFKPFLYTLTGHDIGSVSSCSKVSPSSQQATSSFILWRDDNKQTFAWGETCKRTGEETTKTGRDVDVIDILE